MSILIDLESPMGQTDRLVAVAWQLGRSWQPVEMHALIDRLRGAPTYAALLDILEIAFPGELSFANDPR